MATPENRHHDERHGYLSELDKVLGDWKAGMAAHEALAHVDHLVEKLAEVGRAEAERTGKALRRHGALPRLGPHALAGAAWASGPWHPAGADDVE